VRFEARELEPYAEPVSADELAEGEVYFSVRYVDEEMAVPGLLEREGWRAGGVEALGGEGATILGLRVAAAARRRTAAREQPRQNAKIPA